MLSLLVECEGIEPSTVRMQTGCSPDELAPQVGHQLAPVAGRVPDCVVDGGRVERRSSPPLWGYSPLKLAAHTGETAFSVPYRSGRPGRTCPCNLLDVDQALYC